MYAVRKDGRDDFAEAKGKTNASSRRSEIHPLNVLLKPTLTDPRTSKANFENLKQKARVLYTVRKALPIWRHAAEICQGLRDKNVMLLVGETGSGKSTQVPQMLIHEPWCNSRSLEIPIEGHTRFMNVGGCIAVTEPRRVAAISLARRVAEEMGTPLGSSSPASRVGYSVRFDNSTSPNTQIKYLTEGMLLQEMLRDPWLRQYSAVVVDEVHERGLNVDLVLGFLRNMLASNNEGRSGLPLKVTVMSATADMEGLIKFFDQDDSQEARLPKSASNTNESVAAGTDGHGPGDESEWSGISTSEDEQQDVRNPSKPNVEGGKHRLQDGETQINRATAMETRNGDLIDGSANVRNLKTQRHERRAHDLAVCFIEGRQYPVKILYAPEPVQDWVDAALRTIFQVHYKEPMPGDILVFLTGQETIESLHSLIKEYALGMSTDVPKILVLPLYAALPQSAQQRIFHPAPPRTRKIILATNVAETSVTVPGVRFVVDCGKAKTKQFRPRLGLDSLLVKPISKSAAIQRKGRAGREAPGKCYRLYTEKDYLALQPSNGPEILRCDLSQAILTIKARSLVNAQGASDIFDFPYLDRPPREALEKAFMRLLQLGALTELGDISPLGAQLAKLPITASFGRVLLAAAEVNVHCLSAVVDIISCLNVETVFVNLESEERKEQAETARRELYRREGDHLTLLITVQAYAAERSDRKAWAERHFVSHRAMQAVMVRLELTVNFPYLFRTSFHITCD